MRRNFAQILKSAKIDYRKEYKKLYDILFTKDMGDDYHEKHSIYDLFDESFTSFRFRGTCLSLQEFDKENGFSFPSPDNETDIEMDNLILLMEYFYNLLIAYQSCAGFGGLFFNYQFYIEHIINVCEAIGYKQAFEDGFCIFVEKDSVATAVAESELIPEDFSYKIITYNHHSMRGDIEGKKTILVKFASILEGKRKDLEKVNSTLANDLFYIFNNFNVRHNNCDSSVKGKYKPYIAKMKKDDLEKWYDEAYQMCLLAFMELEQADRKPKFDALKAEIEK